MTQHSSLTGADLHEPKGAASALVNQVYVADGAGSGSWKKIYLEGWEDQNDTGSTQNLTSGAWVDITNDGAGSFTNTSYTLPGVGAVWDTTNHQFDFSNLQLGDTIDLRMDMDVTTNTASDEIALRIDFAHGTGSEFSLEFFRNEFKTSGTFNVIVDAHFYIGSDIVKNNPAKIAMFADTAGDSIAVNGWYAKVAPFNPIYN